MKNKYIQLLLEKIHKLELKISNLKENQNVSFSFFKESFKQTQEINRLLHELEFVQIEDMKSQMEKLVQFLSESESSKSEIIKQTEAEDKIIEDYDRDIQKKSVQEKITLNSKAGRDVSVVPKKTPLKEVTAQEINEDFPLIKEKEKEEKVVISKNTIEEEQKTHAKKNIKEDLSDSINIDSGNMSNKSLNDIQPTSQTILDTKISISLNDRFLFQRELFDNNRQAMNSMMQKLQEFKSYNECEDYLRQTTDWNFNDESVEKFIQMLKKTHK